MDGECGVVGVGMGKDQSIEKVQDGKVDVIER